MIFLKKFTRSYDLQSHYQESANLHPLFEGTGIKSSEFFGVKKTIKFCDEQASHINAEKKEPLHWWDKIGYLLAVSEQI